MKKILFILSLGLLLTGCTTADDLPTSFSPSKETNNQYEELSNKTKDNLTNQENMDNTNSTASEILAPDKQPNLLEDYTSAVIKTNMGDITVEFYNADSPVTVNNFMYLAKQGFYNGTIFHRVIKDFMIQGGDPLSKEADVSRHGTGGPNYRFNDEFNERKLIKGSLAMANSGPGTNGSQFFIVTAESTPWLDGRHTNFGNVTEGLDVVLAINNVATGAADHPISDVIIQDIILK